MAMYSANHPNRVVTLHKDGCRHCPSGLQHCGCGSTSAQQNQQ